MVRQAVDDDDKRGCYRTWLTDISEDAIILKK